MEKITAFLEKHLMPIAGKMANQKHIQAIRDGIIVTMPLTIIGSVFLIIANFPIDAYTNFLRTHGMMFNGAMVPFSDVLSYPVTATFNLMGIIACIGISYRLAEKYNVDALTGAVLAFCTFILVTPYNIAFNAEDGKLLGNVSGLSFNFLGSAGLFVGLLMAILTVEIYRIIVQKDIIIKMPDGVPPAVSKSFAALIPGMVVITLAWIVKIILMKTSFNNMHQIVGELLVKPLSSLGDSYLGAVVVTLLIHLLWITGIHGAALIMGIIQPITNTMMGENAAAVNAGQAMPHVITTQFFDIFQSMGGSGSTFSLAIMLLLLSKSKQLKEIGKLSIGPACFNINEPILFGLPIVMNPMMMIPFVLAPIAAISITYFTMKYGLVTRLSGVMIPWTTPPILGGFLSTRSISGAIVQIVNMIVTFGIYYPFFKIIDKQKLDEEAGIGDGREAA